MTEIQSIYPQKEEEKNQFLAIYINITTSFCH